MYFSSPFRQGFETMIEWFRCSNSLCHAGSSGASMTGCDESVCVMYLAMSEMAKSGIKFGSPHGPFEYAGGSVAQSW